MLEFLGNGSAFNTKLGNTSAFIKENEKLFLIDCGETVFATLKEKKILNDVKEIFIAITHLHSDHAGSLSSLIYYMHYIKKVKTKILVDFSILYDDDLKELLRINGCQYNIMYEFIHISTLAKEFDCINKFEFIPCIHDKNLKSYSIKIDTDLGILYYTGDTSDITPLLKLFDSESLIYAIYTDTCSSDYEENVHLSINKLEKYIPKKHRNRVYCIHLDDIKLKDKISSLGFQLPKMY